MRGGRRGPSMRPMNSVIRIPRRVVAPFAVAGALFIVPAAASAASVEPVFHDGNPTCADLGYNHGLKFDPPAAGSLSADGVTVDVSLDSDGFGTLVDWTASAPIDAVIVKGGSNANAYTYPGESSGDNGLHTPFNGPDKYFGLSHVDFCWDDQTPPPPDDETPPPAAVPPTVQTPPAPPAPPEGGEVLGAQIVAGQSRLLGPSGCAGKTVKATVRGRQIALVTFKLDGKKVKTVKGAGSYSVDSSKLKAGVHRIKARVTYKAASQTPARTHVVTFQRCVQRKIKPRFAG
jgi:hypothetical protein